MPRIARPGSAIEPIIILAPTHLGLTSQLVNIKLKFLTSLFIRPLLNRLGLKINWLTITPIHSNRRSLTRGHSRQAGIHVRILPVTAAMDGLGII